MTVKIRFQLQIFIVFAVISFSTSNILFAQDTILNKYGLWVIKESRTLNSTIMSDNNKQMVDIKKLIPNIILDLRYATTNNFMHRKLYPAVTTTYLRLPVSYTHLRAHETVLDLVCRLLLEKKKKKQT